MAVVVFVNPGSRANRKDPACAERFARILGAQGRVAAPPSLEQLAVEAERVAAEAPAIIGIHGGDGTLHRTLTALVAAYGSRPLPPIAILPGGTMNVVAASLGVRKKPEDILAEVVLAEQAGLRSATMQRRCLRVGNEVGFIFGNGLLTNFLEEYYARGRYGTRRALWIIVRIVLSLLSTGRYAKRIFRRFRGRVEVDGQVLPHDQLASIGAATVTEIGFRFKLHHRADEDPTRMEVLAIHSAPIALLLDLVNVRLGRGISRKRATSMIASQLDIVPDATDCTYTLDGDVYCRKGPLSVELGPVLHIVQPGGAKVLRDEHRP